MKKILASLLMVIIVGALTTTATKAYFSDTETSTGNTFAAGSLDLVMGATETLPFEVSNVVPGDHGKGTVRLTNNGSTSGTLLIQWTKTIDAENDMLLPETLQYPRPNGAPGLTTGDYDGNGGELDMFLQFAPFVDVNKDGIFNTGDIQLAYGGQSTFYPAWRGGDLYYSGLNSYLSAWNNVMTLNNGESVDIVIPWEFPTESTDANYSQNISMTDSLGFDMQFVLNQAH